MAVIPEDVLEALEDEKKICMLASVDEIGSVNVVPVGSVMAIGDQHIAYACCFNGKTMTNLKDGRSRVAIALYKPRMEGFQIKGIVQKTEDSGELFEQFSEKVNPMLEMMGSKGSTKSVVTIKVTEVYALTLPIAGEKLA